MTRDQILDDLEQWTRDELLGGDPSSTLTPSSPLLEWKVLSSLNIARLLSHIREDIGVNVGPQHIVASNFRDLDAVASLVDSLDTQEVA